MTTVHDSSLYFLFSSSSESSDDEEPAKPAKPLTFANKKEAIDAFKQLLKEKVHISVKPEFYLHIKLLRVSHAFRCI